MYSGRPLRSVSCRSSIKNKKCCGGAAEKVKFVMNENEKELIQPEETTEQKKTPKHRQTMAALRALAAVLVAVILLAVTGFGGVDMLRGAKESDSILDEEQGAFVKRDVFAILGFYADKATGDEVSARYAVVPMGGKLATVKFTNRYLEAAKAVEESTYGFVNGENQTLDSYVIAQGTVSTLTEDESALLYDWFGLNKDQLVEMRMIAETDDYADYLSDSVLLVDTVNGRSQILVIALSAAAILLVLYAVIELFMIAVGAYKPKKEQELCCCGEGHEGEDCCCGGQEEHDVCCCGEQEEACAREAAEAEDKAPVEAEQQTPEEASEQEPTAAEKKTEDGE